MQRRYKTAMPRGKGGVLLLLLLYQHYYYISIMLQVKIKLRFNLFYAGLILNFLSLPALIIHDLGLGGNGN